MSKTPKWKQTMHNISSNYEKMTTDELRKEIRKLTTIAQARQRNLRKNRLGKYAGVQKFITYSKSRKDLLSTFKEVQKFLNKESTTVTGAKKLKKKRIENFQKLKESVGSENVSDKTFARMLQINDKLNEIYPEWGELYSPIKFSRVFAVMEQKPNLSIDEYIVKLENKYKLRKKEMDFYEQGTEPTGGLFIP